MPASWRDRGWAAARRAQPDVPLVPGTDPEHATPGPDEQVTWVADTMVATLPPELVGDQLLQLPAIGGPVDRDPHDPMLGQGGGHYTDAENRAVMGPYHRADPGTVASRRWQPPGSRDGAYHVDVVPDPHPASDGTSPQTLVVREQTGYGTPLDPGARLGQRIQRWRDRWIDRHMWGVEPHPAYVRNAYTGRGVPAGPRSQYSSPYPTNQWSGKGGIGTPDQLVMPTERRVPRPWGEDQTTDPTTGAPDQALGSWGL
jgi:hypothetical protein